ncbi:MAG: hypothetical protein IJN07_07065 [Clostridia bacterium]|nr:hypothetical protein [Clostridia bacterium]
MSKKNLLQSGKSNKVSLPPAFYYFLMIISSIVMRVIKQKMNISDENPFFTLTSFAVVGIFLVCFSLALKKRLNKKATALRAILTFSIIIYCFGVVLGVLNWITGGALL